MKLYEQWKALAESQTEETFESFWAEYSAAEVKLYGEILDHPGIQISGSFDALAQRYEISPALLMGFLDGIRSSLKQDLDLESMTGDTEVTLDVDPAKLYFNMHAAQAEHLYSLSQWETVLSAEKRAEIVKAYRRSRTVVKEKEPGRNDPCPCGSGKKYKKCCGV